MQIFPPFSASNYRFYQYNFSIQTKKLSRNDRNRLYCHKYNLNFRFGWFLSFIYKGRLLIRLIMRQKENNLICCYFSFDLKFKKFFTYKYKKSRFLLPSLGISSTFASILYRLNKNLGKLHLFEWIFLNTQFFVISMAASVNIIDLYF